MEDQGIIAYVDYPTDWVSNMQVVEKSNGGLRICLDPKALNQCIKREHYLIPTQQDLFSRLSGKRVFTVLDLSSGFWQMELDRKSSDLTTFMTPFGRFRWTRVPFGLNNAPEMFQRKMVQIFGDIEGVEIYFDDMAIAGVDEAEHDYILSQVMQLAREHNVKFNMNKLQFRTDCVKFMGNMIGNGKVHPLEKDVRAITDMPRPENVADVTRFLGLLYTPGKSLLVADCLSRAALQETGEVQEELEHVVHALVKKACMSQDNFDLYVEKLNQDERYLRIVKYVQTTWPPYNKLDDLGQLFYKHLDELHFENGLLFKDHRLVIPTALQTTVCKWLHAPHMGTEKTLSRARTQFFWPGITNDIKEVTSNCMVCEKFRRNNQKEPLMQDPSPEYPFHRVSTDIYEYGGNDCNS
nr:uncharacterized protein K02A2.6-like [Aedes albopictus]